MIDLKKAFDTVDFDLLIEKLKYYGIGQHTLNWFTNYLYERYQKPQSMVYHLSFYPFNLEFHKGPSLGLFSLLCTSTIYP